MRKRVTVPLIAIMLLLIQFGESAWAQQDPLFTQYAFNKLAFNPAYAGSGERFSLDLLTRFQWTGIRGAPRTVSFNAHTPLRNRHIGIGINACRDELGPLTDNQVMAAFAYRILFPSTTLCFGIQGGVRHMDVNTGLLDPRDPADPLLEGAMTKKAVPDADAGIYFYGSRFYTGISVRHLLENRILVSATAPADVTAFTRLQRNLYGMAGGVVPLGRDLEMIPSVLVRYMTDVPLQADLNLNFLLKKVLTAGIAYRTDQAMALMIQVSVGKGFSIGYSYDLWFNVLRSYNQGSHEIRIGFETDLFRPLRVLTPRYF